MTPNLDQSDDIDARDMVNAREVLTMFRHGFAELSADEQLQEVASFVLERREELARSPELQQWLAAGLN
ncbi:hypothetical protein [Hydrogenophaga aquatica]